MSKAFKAIIVMLIIFAASVYLTPVFHSFLPMFKFEKIFDRLVMIFTIVAAVIFVILEQRKKKGMKTQFWQNTGFNFSTPWKKLFWYGFLSGSLAVAFLIAWQVGLGPRYLRQPILVQDIVGRLFKGMLSGVVVGIVEEFFFRGFIFNYLRSRMNLIVAVLISSAFYSLTHFLDNGQIFIPQNPTAGDAFRLLVGYLEPFAKHWNEIFPEFVGLFIFGIILCLVFIRTRSLFFSIGIHAGVVFMIKFQHSFVRKPDEDIVYGFFGKSPDYDGSFEWLVLVILGLVLWFVILPRVDSPRNC